MKKEHLILAIVVIAILGGAFYWYSYKPQHIRERCYAEGEFTQEAIAQPDATLRGQIIDNYYNDCLKRFGISEK